MRDRPRDVAGTRARNTGASAPLVRDPLELADVNGGMMGIVPILMGMEYPWILV